MDKRLRANAFDSWLMYSLVFEFHWRPKDIFEMEDWELGMIWSLMKRHGKEIERVTSRK